MIINPSLVQPSQNFLKPKTVHFIFDCLEEGNNDDLPPAPIVRKDGQGAFVAIDGHNLLAVKAFLGQDLEIHLAESADDGLPETSLANKIRNKELLEKYDTVLNQRDECAVEGIGSFQDLIQNNMELFSNHDENL